MRTSPDIPLHLNETKGPLASLCKAFARLQIIMSRETIVVSNATSSLEDKNEIGTAANSFVAHVGDDGFVRMSEYGSFTHNVGMQDFDEAAANAIVKHYDSAWRKVKAAVFGGSANIPIYYWHPDDIQFAANGSSDDTTRYGEFTALEVRPDGLYGRPEYTDAGNALLNGGVKLWFSLRWMMERRSLPGIKPKRWSPFKLLSVGLTEKPNIYGAAANAAQNTEPNNDMLKKLLEALGYNEEEIAAIEAGTEGAPDADAIIAKIQKKDPESGGKADPDPKKPESDDKTEKEEDPKVAEANKAKEKAEEELVAANAAFKAERRARSELLVDSAIAERKVSPANRNTEVDALAGASEFDVAANALSQRKPVLPGGGNTADLGKRKSELQAAANAASEFEGKVEELVAANGYNRDQAWAEAKTMHKALYEAMLVKDN